MSMGTEIIFAKKSLTEQVTENMAEAFRAGRWSENSRLPSSRELALQYGASHNVMLKALQQLQEDDLVYLLSKRGGYHIKR